MAIRTLANRSPTSAPSSKLIHKQFNQDAGGKERLLMELILTHKPHR